MSFSGGFMMATTFASNPDQEFAQLAAFFSPRGIAVANGQSRRVERMTAARQECWVVLVEPASPEHTGDCAHAITTSIEQQLAHLRSPNLLTRQQETSAQWPSKS